MIKILLISAVPGLLVAAFTMYAAWQHNPQGEFHTDGAIEWSNWLSVGLSWFLLVFIGSVLVFIGSVLVEWLISWMFGKND